MIYIIYDNVIYMCNHENNDIYIIYTYDIYIYIYIFYTHIYMITYVYCAHLAFVRFEHYSVVDHL